MIGGRVVNFLRLIPLLILLLSWAFPAQAVLLPKPDFCVSHTCLSTIASSQGEACAKLYPSGNSATGWYDAASDACYGSVGANNKRFGPFSLLALAASCPANSNQSGSECICTTNYIEENGACVRKPITCPEGQEEQGGACVPKSCKATEIRVNGFCVPDPDLCPDGSQKVDGECKKKKCERDKDNDVVGAKSIPSAMCFNGCTVIKQKGFVCTEDGCTYTYTNTGGTCDSPPYDPSKPPGANDDKDKDKDTEGNTGGGNTGGGNTGGGGGGTNNNGNKGPNVPGTDTDSKGECPAGKYKSEGKCFNNDPDKKPPDPDKAGNGGCPDDYTLSGTTCVANQPSSDKDKDKDFCQANPELSICKGSSFAGSCGASFACEGDVIQCAIAKEQHRLNCKLYGLDDDSGSAVNKALSGNDAYSMDKLKSEAQQVAVGTFDQAGLGWSHSCPADPSIPLNFGGRSAEFKIPFSRICGPLGILSLAGVGLTLLGSMVWVLGGRNNRG